MGQTPRSVTRYVPPVPLTFNVGAKWVQVTVVEGDDQVCSINLGAYTRQMAMEFRRRILKTVEDTTCPFFALPGRLRHHRDHNDCTAYKLVESTLQNEGAFPSGMPTECESFFIWFHQAHAESFAAVVNSFMSALTTVNANPRMHQSRGEALRTVEAINRRRSGTRLPHFTSLRPPPSTMWSWSISSKPATWTLVFHH